MSRIFSHHTARAGALASQAFYEACRARLSEQGLLVANLFGQLRGYKTQLQRLGKAFDGRVLALAPVASGNVVPLTLLEPLRRTLNIVYHKRKYLSESMQRFIALCRETGEQ